MSWQAWALWGILYINLGAIGWCLAEDDFSGLFCFTVLAAIGITQALGTM